MIRARSVMQASARTLGDFRLMLWLYDDRSIPDPKHPTPVDALQQTLSWRVTAPLRSVRAVQLQVQALRGGGNPDRQRLLDNPESVPDPSALELNRLEALRMRLVAVVPVLAPELDVRALSTSELLEELLRRVRRDGRISALWTLFASTAGAFPTEDTVTALHRRLRLAGDRDAWDAFLQSTGRALTRWASHYRTVEVETKLPVVSVDFCARHGFTSGVQRVVRSTMSSWRGKHPTRNIAWTGDGSAMRVLTRKEEDRVSAWTTRHRHDQPGRALDASARIIIPWRTTVFLPEVAPDRFSDQLASLTKLTENRTVAIGYDMIPAIDGAFVPRESSLEFAKYLSALKYADTIIAISEAVGEEFAGFSSALSAQGLVGAKVAVLSLPSAAPEIVGDLDISAKAPMVLSVGSHEIRKNHITVAYAADVLWRRGHEFSLLFIGGSSPFWYTDLDEKVAELAISGRPVTLLRGVTDEELRTAYGNARFSVFTSLHEGYGLPITESLSAGTPVVTSDRGSMAEIAAEGGCVTVDPTSVSDLVDAMERLLTDDAEIARLRSEIGHRTIREWDAYAEDLWTLLGQETGR